MSDQETNPEWAIVELMGHKVLAGLVQKSEQFGTALMRIDVPATDDYPQYTQFYGNAAIYSLTPVSQEVATLTAAKLSNNPVAVYVPELVTREKYDDLNNRARDEVANLQEEVQRLSKALHLEEQLKHMLPERVNEEGE